MNFKRISAWVMAVSVITPLVWTTIAQLTVGLEGTVSMQAWKLFTTFPLATFGLGAVIGHLVWRSPGSDLVDFEKIKFRDGDLANTSAEYANRILKEKLTKLGKGEL